MFRVTFNKPASIMLKGEAEPGLLIQIKSGVVMFKPVNCTDHPEAVPVMDRTRGGMVMDIEGKMAAQLRNALENECGPFFTLEPVPGGWLSAVKYDGAGPPPKFQPHLRVWDEVVQVISSDIPMEVTPEKVRLARNLLAQYRSKSRPGRPTREVAAAMRLVEYHNQQILDENDEDSDSSNLKTMLQTLEGNIRKIRKYVSTQQNEGLHPPILRKKGQSNLPAAHTLPKLDKMAEDAASFKGSDNQYHYMANKRPVIVEKRQIKRRRLTN